MKCRVDRWTEIGMVSPDYHVTEVLEKVCDLLFLILQAYSRCSLGGGLDPFLYFIYDAKFSHLGLGTFSIIKEIEHTRSLGLKYYCLGYYVQECQRMAYKNNFKPREHYNWLADKWEAT